MSLIRIISLVFITALVSFVGAVTVSTDDGLDLVFDDTTGEVVAVMVDGNALPLTGEWGGLSIQRLTHAPPVAPVEFDFNTDGGPWTAAQNSNWESGGDFVTWQASGGPDGSGHLLLGDGASSGAGMALTDRYPVERSMELKISFQMMTASTETKQILGVRLYDDMGNDITGTFGSLPHWAFSQASLAHVVYDFGNQEPNTWEPQTFSYIVPEGVAFIGVTLRHWTGGDHLVHIDDLSLTLTGGLIWNDPIPVSDAPLVSGDGITIGATMFNGELEVDASIQPAGNGLAMEFDLQAIPDTRDDMPLVIRWNLPIDVEGWTWWHDIATSEVIADPVISQNAFTLGGHPMSWYPLSAVASSQEGLGLSVPMEQALIQNFQADPNAGLSSSWYVGLSPLTEKIGQGHAAMSLLLERHDPAWGFRSALQRYQERRPHLFEKRTTVEGSWQWPVPVTEIENAQDFGFGHQEHWQEVRPLDAADLQAQRDMGIVPCAYVEPWIIWQGWADYAEQPPTEVMLARLHDEANNNAHYFQWKPNGGVGDSGHLLVGDGYTAGGGMALAEHYTVSPGETLTVTWSERASDTETLQIIGFRCFDAGGADITDTLAVPSGWIWTTGSRAHVQVGFGVAQVNTWETFQHTYTVPPGVARVMFSLRHWTGGNHRVQIEDLSIVGTETLVDENFDIEPTDINRALNSDWEQGDTLWHRERRANVAAMVLNSSPHNADDVPVYNDIRMFKVGNSGTSGSMRYPLNSDPDLPEPSCWTHHKDFWLDPGLALDDGIYFDSTTAIWGIGNWLNFRPDHLAVVDHPLTFDRVNGRAAQVGISSIAEYMEVAAPIIRGQDKRMMINLFPEGNRHLAHWADQLGYEVTQLDQDQDDARLQRSLAGHRIVSNLLQLFINADFQDDYATYDDMEQHMFGQVFWGFFPSVSSNGKDINGAPDRYFDHPELYNRDRPLFQRWMPIVAAMNDAGWEPLTHAQAEGLDIERFGPNDAGEVFFSVRSADGTSITADVTTDLTALGVLGQTTLRELASDEQVFPLKTPAVMIWSVSLGADEVKVYRISPTNPLGVVVSSLEQ